MSRLRYRSLCCQLAKLGSTVAGGHSKKSRQGWLHDVATARDALAVRRAAVQLEEALYGERTFFFFSFLLFSLFCVLPTRQASRQRRYQCSVVLLYFVSNVRMYVAAEVGTGIYDTTSVLFDRRCRGLLAFFVVASLRSTMPPRLELGRASLGGLLMCVLLQLGGYGHTDLISPVWALSAMAVTRPWCHPHLLLPLQCVRPGLVSVNGRRENCFHCRVSLFALLTRIGVPVEYHLFIQYRSVPPPSHVSRLDVFLVCLFSVLRAIKPARVT